MSGFSLVQIEEDYFRKMVDAKFIHSVSTKITLEGLLPARENQS